MPELTEDRWEKPGKSLPSYELIDVSGKTWRLQDMKEKVLLINVWATWCGPCQSELPHLEKLYEMLRDRADIQILSFNIDEDPGLVGPFLKEHGYKFPVLLANSFAPDLSAQGIPQNWIVGPTGSWEWKQLGYGGVDGWEEDIVKKMESLRAAAH